MGWIEDIEKPFHAVFARLTVVKKEQWQGEQAQILQIKEGRIGVIDAQGDQAHGKRG